MLAERESPVTWVTCARRIAPLLAVLIGLASCASRNASHADPGVHNDRANVQFRLVLDAPSADSETVLYRHPLAEGRVETLHLARTPLLDHVAVKSATVQKNPISGLPEVVVRFHPDAAASVRQFTQANTFRRMAIVIDGTVISTARVVTPIDGNELLIGNIASTSEASRQAKAIDKAAAR
jgi:preprotein translocase subunit SecD